MGKYDTAVRCAQIKNLINEHQYLKAMEEIEELNFEKVPSIADLYLFSDIFLRAEKMDVAKEIYYTVYRRTASRPALYRLLMLVIRMGDIEEAKELYLTYEIIAGLTLDTYELRYRLAKAEGEPRTKLIEILEQLKNDEYTEEWGLQLARLYEIEGMREKCIEECDELERWFGSGAIVEKARELRKRCMSPSWVKPMDDKIPEPEIPDLVEEPVGVAHAPVHVEDILPEKHPDTSGDNKKDVKKSTKEDTKKETAIAGEPFAEDAYTVQETVEPEAIAEETPEVQESQETEPEAIAEETPEVQELQEAEPETATEEASEMQESESEAAVEETPEMQEGESETAAEEAPEEQEAEPEPVQPKPGLFHRIVNYFKVDLENFGQEEEEDKDKDKDKEEFPEELDTYKQQSTAELNVKAILAEGVDGIMDESAGAAEIPDEGILATRRVPRPPVESLEEQLQKMEENKQVINLDDTINVEEPQIKSHPLGRTVADEEVYEDISRNGIAYCTLKGTISKLHQNDGIVNFVLTGGTDELSLVVAKKLIKELKKINYSEAKNIGKITAEKLNGVNLDEWAEKFVGGCMYIIDAPSLANQSVESLIRLIDKYREQIVIILEGSYDEIDSFLNFHKELEERIAYKVKL